MDSTVINLGQTPANGPGTPASKKIYHAPNIRHFGNMTDIVQAAGARGADGETIWTDCTFT